MTDSDDTAIERREPGAGPDRPGGPDPRITGVTVVERSSVSIGHTPHRGRLWWSFLVSGLLCVGFGLAILFLPRQAAQLAVVLLGALGVFAGIMLVWGALASRAEVGRLGFGLVPGIVLVAGGLAFVYFNGTVARFFVVVWAVIALLIGVWDIASAVMNRQEGRWWRLLRGLLFAVAGVAFLVSPQLGVVAAGILIGLVLISIGLSTLALVVATRQTGI